MIHTAIKKCLCLCLFLVITISYADAGTGNSSETDYSRLLDFIAMENLQGPLVLFENNEGDFDSELNQENIAYLNQNESLLMQIKTRLKGETLKWELAASSKRVLFVPEQRGEYAQLFQRYCQEAIQFVLERIQSPNPYAAISTLEGPPPDEVKHEQGGISAYLVHNIADEYIEEYVFFNQDNDNTKIKIKLSNRAFSGKIGAYSSKIVIGQDQTFSFIRDPYTMWQNSASDPLNVFIAPIEETLHIILRGATETGIQNHLILIQPERLNEVQQVVDDWMAVEEAIVGGLVAKLMPEVLEHFINHAYHEKLNESFARRHEHAQYRYLDEGIKVVTDLGLEEAIKLYKSDPQQFRELVSSPEMAYAN